MLFKRLAVLFYVTTYLFIGSFLILFSVNKVNLEQLFFYIQSFYIDQNLRIVTGILGAALLVLNFIFYKMVSVNVHRDKMVAFDNPSGRVTVSLLAMEDLIKRLLITIYEIRDVKSVILATKKGLQVKIKLNLLSEVSIPELSKRVQDLVTKKIQETIGLDEKINVGIYVSKITLEQVKEKKKVKKDKKDDKPTPNVPFQGYRA